jgi:hypothetical protein
MQQAAAPETGWQLKEYACYLFCLFLFLFLGRDGKVSSLSSSLDPTAS